MSRPRGAISNAGWSTLFAVWNIGISFLLTPLMIHYLGVDHYGILLLMWSITGIMGITNLGFGEATLRYEAYHYGKRDLASINRVFGATLSFNVIICGVVFVGMFFGAPIIAAWLKIHSSDQRLVVWLLRTSAVIFSVGLITRTFAAIPMALMRYDISSKIHIGHSIVRSIGYLLLVITKFGTLSLLAYDAVISSLGLCIWLLVARRLIPELNPMPSFSFKWLREILGYSLFSFLNYVFLTLHREVGKLALGRLIDPAAVAFFGTPDNVAQRGHALVVSGSETLLPRFSANEDPKVGRALLLNATWACLFASIVLLIPMIVLMEDFLRLWINAEFASASASVGQLVALSYITQGALAPASSYFRGSGKPWVVTAVVFFAGICTLVFCVLLIPSHGVVGAGYACVLGSVVHLIGLLITWFFICGTSSILLLMRYIGIPLIIAGISFALGRFILKQFIDITWPVFFGLGGLFVGMTAIFLLVVDRLIGGESPSKELFRKIRKFKLVEKLVERSRKGRSVV